ncbi:MAG: MBOAT family protein, partial [Gammaproteobacteria bacterium]|nr:MBOAT family protein [Gammaproteobacteria bacterium]
MLFNSLEFIFLFLPIVFVGYYYLLHKRLFQGAKSLLVAASLFYYAWWNVNYLPIILLTLLFNYVVGNILSASPSNRCISRKVILVFSISLNLLLLGYYKYTDFLIENINFFTHIPIDSIDLVLPLAISFFTFQQIAYLIDCYKREADEYDFLNYALFVTFFPQLIAGPIVHHKEMMPQFDENRNYRWDAENFAVGLSIFALGLAKKVLLA